MRDPVSRGIAGAAIIVAALGFTGTPEPAKAAPSTPQPPSP
jgi:hypothetical protein